MNRGLRTTLLALALAAGLAAAPTPRVVVVRGPASNAVDEHLAGFTARLKMPVEVETLDGETTGLGRRLRSDPPALVFAVGTSAAEFAARSRTTAPVLFSMVYAAGEHGLEGLPGVAGLTLKAPPAETVKALSALYPGQRLRVGALYHSAAARSEAESVRSAVTARGDSFEAVEVASAAEVGPALNRLLPRIDVLWLLADPAVLPDAEYLRFILKKALDRRVAVVGLSESHVRLGALLAVSVDYRLEGAAAAGLAEKILAGAGPSSIGVLPPQSLAWSINSKVAEELGVPLPAMVRKRFEKVYP